MSDQAAVMLLAAVVAANMAVICAAVAIVVALRRKPWMPLIPVRLRVWRDVPNHDDGEILLGEILLHMPTLPTDGNVVTANFGKRDPNGTLPAGCPEPGRWRCIIRGGWDVDMQNNVTKGITMNAYYLNTIPEEAEA